MSCLPFLHIVHLDQCVPLRQRIGSISIPAWADGGLLFLCGCELHCGSWKWLWPGRNGSPHNPSPENTGTKVQDTNKSSGSPSWLRTGSKFLIFRNDSKNYDETPKVLQYSKYTVIFHKWYIPKDIDGFQTPLLLHLLVLHQPAATSTPYSPSLMVVWGAWFNQTSDRRSRKLEWGSYFSRSSWKGSRNAFTSCTLRALEEERRCVQARMQQTCKTTAMLNLLWKDEMHKQF